jgi:hypothetical protein
MARGGGRLYRLHSDHPHLSVQGLSQGIQALCILRRIRTPSPEPEKGRSCSSKPEVNRLVDHNQNGLSLKLLQDLPSSSSNPSDPSRRSRTTSACSTLPKPGQYPPARRRNPSHVYRRVRQTDGNALKIDGFLDEIPVVPGRGATIARFCPRSSSGGSISPHWPDGA